MKVSIITACYNSSKTIEETLSSVVNQTYNDLEYIIIDGASKDNTLSVVDKFKDRISKVVSEPDKGIYDALNKGIERSTGDIVGLLHADDFYTDSNVIEKIVDVFNATDSDAVYADLDYVDDKDPSKIIRHWKSGKYKDGDFMWGWMPPHPTFFVKKSCYEKYGLFSLELKSAADYELMLRFIHKNKIKLAYLPEVVVKMRVGGMSNASLKNRIRANNEDRKAWVMNGIKPYFFTLYLKPLRKLKQYFGG